MRAGAELRPDASLVDRRLAIVDRRSTVHFLSNHSLPVSVAGEPAGFGVG
jgi:hypothetical protein